MNLSFLNGYKTYITAIVTAAYAAIQCWNGELSLPAAEQAIQVALLGAFIRHGVSTSTKQ